MARFIAQHPYLSALLVIATGITGLTHLHNTALLTNETIFGYVLEHLCIALIVAGFVGIGYEVAGHTAKMAIMLDELETKSAHHLTNLEALTNRQIEKSDLHFARLESLTSGQVFKAEQHLARLESITTAQIDKFTHATDEQTTMLVALVTKRAEDALPYALKAIFRGTPTEAELLERSKTLLRAVKTIHDRDLWIDSISLRFIGELLGYASRNAGKLASPGIEDGDILHLELPLSSVKLADEILANEMEGLKDGDAYLVLSDYGSWGTPSEIVFSKEATQFALGKFYGATLRAVNECGVTVRRIFSRCNTDTGVSQEQAVEILKRHWEDANKSERDANGEHRYQVGIVTRRAFTEIGYEREHRGVFIHEGKALCFSPTGPHLNVMRIQMRPERDERERFDRFWRSASKSSAVVDGSVVEQSLDDILTELGQSWWDI